MMSRLKALLNIGLYFFIVLFITMLITIIMLGNGSSMTEIEDFVYSITTYGAMMLGALLVICLINWRYLKQKLAYGLNHFKETLGYGCLGYLATLGILTIYGFIKVLVLGRNGIVDSENEAAIEMMSAQANFVVLFLTMVVITPFLEEIVFRVSLLGLLIKDQKSKKYYCYILAAIIFALLHGVDFIFNFNAANVMNFIEYLLLSGALVFVYYKSNHNLLAVYLLHACNNLTALITLVLFS